jgi:hypothetical protein
VTRSLVVHVPKAGNRVSEDSWVVRDRIAVVADGVTRTPAPGQAYPRPSPAKLAADTIVRVVGETTTRLAATLSTANCHVRDLNAQLGLEGPYERGEDDLAGAVAAAARVFPGWVEWTYIGDSGVALLSPTGDAMHVTPDDIAPLRPSFPSCTDMHPSDRMRIVREGYRNQDSDPAFGVLTGETWATRFIRSGVWRGTGGCTVIVFSDGFRPLLRDRHLCVSLVRANHPHGALEDIVLKATARHAVTDDVSAAILARIPG